MILMWLGHCLRSPAAPPIEYIFSVNLSLLHDILLFLLVDFYPWRCACLSEALQILGPSREMLKASVIHGPKVFHLYCSFTVGHKVDNSCMAICAAALVEPTDHPSLHRPRYLIHVGFEHSAATRASRVRFSQGSNGSLDVGIACSQCSDLGASTVYSIT